MELRKPTLERYVCRLTAEVSECIIYIYELVWIVLQWHKYGISSFLIRTWKYMQPDQQHQLKNVR